ncbi:MAG: helix-turn-helix domain-containing protein [Elusimicrobia bacterium]|nr:helix-turn-helix domain-containing protein [Elusimicrobiota bacterium]
MFEAAELWRQDETALRPGRLILRLRRGLQVSQRELARRSGVPRSQLERIEAGKDCRMSSILRLMEALGCALVVLPASEPLLAEFKEKATRQARCDREWEEAKAELRRTALPDPPGNG